MSPISFCINTTKAELEYLKLLFKSLHYNLSTNNHEILVFVENDTETDSVVKFLISQKTRFPQLKIIKNTLPIPVGYARNINYMFEMAAYNIVSYLQSDMVICKNYDIEILKGLDHNTILSSTRIEPPLHPHSDEKITYNFGLDPSTFNFEGFVENAEKCKQNKFTDYWFAPFTLYKDIWVKIGGHDTIFRRSREDSDLLYRFSMLNINLKQTWNAYVYHFTCTSSRGKNWWKPENRIRSDMQKLADSIEMTRFLQKWPAFKHTTSFNPDTEYKYHISVNFLNVKETNIADIIQNYYFFQRLYIDNDAVRQSLQKKYNTFHEYANSLLNISTDEWQRYKKYYRYLNGNDIFPESPINNDNIIIEWDLEKCQFPSNILPMLNDIMHNARNDSPGDYEFNGLIIRIKKIENIIQNNITAYNPPIDDIEFKIY